MISRYVPCSAGDRWGEANREWPEVYGGSDFCVNQRQKIDGGEGAGEVETAVLRARSGVF